MLLKYVFDDPTYTHIYTNIHIYIYIYIFIYPIYILYISYISLSFPNTSYTEILVYLRKCRINLSGESFIRQHLPIHSLTTR